MILMPTEDQEKQLVHLTGRVKAFFPELEGYEIGLEYADLPKGAGAQICFGSRGEKLDYGASLRKAKPIFKTFSLNYIKIRFSKLVLNLKHGLRKDVIMYFASHELTHFLEVPKILHSEKNLGIDFDKHSEEFYRIQLERFNKFRFERQQPPVKDRVVFEGLIFAALNKYNEGNFEGQSVDVTGV